MNKPKLLNLGSGTDYREEWVNVDNNPNFKADVYADISKSLPFKDNTFDEVILFHVIEHFEKKEVFKILEEIHRVCKPRAVLHIKAPHYTSVLAFKVPYHYSYYGIDTFRIFEEQETGLCERYSPARFKMKSQRLHLVLNRYDNFKVLKYLRPLDVLFNFCKTWQLIMERMFFPGFDEVEYVMEITK